MTDRLPPASSSPPEDADELDSVTRIVIEALELEGDDRLTYLDDACGDDAELRAEVDSLLAEDEVDEPGFLEGSAAERLASLATTVEEGLAGEVPSGEPAPMPSQIGPYRILDQLGEGGMATVYLAELDEPVHRRVALKVIRPLKQRRVRARFAVECQALARLNHPNVSALYEVGSTGERDGGTPYVAMEWVEGKDIIIWCDERQADLATRLRLFVGVCAGIRHAHEKGVLHCDLKPSNVLVTEIDGKAVAKVIDFGIARALDEPLIPGNTNLTGEMFVGSPLYVSPEAAQRGGRKTLDARSDVYSLGLILYELLAGVLPFVPGEHTLWTLLKDLSEQKTVPPSERFDALEAEQAAAVAADRQLEPSKLLRKLRGDLDAIVLKATAADPADRYGSPGDLIDEIERHIGHRPVKARDRAPGYVWGRFVRRNLGTVASVLLLLVALAAGLVGRTVEARRANAEADRARVALEESEQVREFIVGLFEAADPDRSGGDAITVRELLDQGATRLRNELQDQPVVRARLLHTVGSIYTELGMFPPAEELISEALELRRQALPADDPEILESQSELGVLYRRRGRFDEAAPLLEGVLAARLESPDSQPSEVALAYNHLGNLYWSQQRYAEAETAHRAALSIRERIEDGGSDEAESANNLGVLLLSRRRYSEARPLLDRAVGLFRRELGPQHPRVAAALNNLGLVERNLETWPRAEELLREAVAIWEDSYGSVHQRTLLGRRSLVDELARKHRWDAAVAEAETVVGIAEQLEGDPLALVQALRLLGRTQDAAGLDQAAADTLRRGVELADGALGAEHLDSQAVRHSFAIALLDLDRISEVRQILEGIASVQDASPDTGQPSRLRTELGFGYLELAAGRPVEAEKHFRRVLQVRSRQLGDEHHSTATAWSDLALALEAQGRWDEAAELFGRALTVRSKTYGPDHPATADSAHDLAEVEIERGNLDRARELLQQAVAIRQEHYPAGDSDLRASLDALSSL